MTTNDPQHLPGTPSLNPADARALEALIDAGFESGRLSSDLKPRAQHAQNLLSLLKDYPVEDPSPALLQSTLDRISAEESQQSERFRFAVQNDAELSTVSRGGFRFRWADLITVAAVILIGSGILMPVLSNVKNRAFETACANNMRNVATALQSYANDNNGTLPMATASLAGSWDTVANFLNLKPLVDGSYCRSQDLECPGHHNHGSAAEPSLSYQWQTAGRPITLDSQFATPVISDKNPLLDPARLGKHLAPLTISVNHGGRGQNILSNDLSTKWLEEPIVNTNDNIWLPAGAEALTPGLVPAQGDVFLAD